MGKFFERNLWQTPSSMLSAMPEKARRDMVGDFVAGGTGLLGRALDVLAMPGDFTRGALVGKAGDRVTGRQFTDRIGITNARNNGPLEFAAGLAADILVDPMNLVTLGAGSALTNTGRALTKGGFLRNMSRLDRMKGFEDTFSGLLAAGRKPEEINHMIRQGRRIATKEMEDFALKRGVTLRPNKPLAGMLSLDVPFTPIHLGTFGTGSTSQMVAGAMDKAGHFLKYGNPIGRSIAAKFDTSVHGATDKNVALGWAKAGHDVFKEGEVAADDIKFRMLAGLNPLLERFGIDRDYELLNTVRALAENAGVKRELDPEMVKAITDAGFIPHIHKALQQSIDSQRAMGRRISEHTDETFGPMSFFPRRATFSQDISSPGTTASGGHFESFGTSAMHRNDPWVGIPGGTWRLNNWINQYAGLGKKSVKPMTAKMYRDALADVKDMGLDWRSKDIRAALRERLPMTAAAVSKLPKSYRGGEQFFDVDIVKDVYRNMMEAAHARGAATAGVDAIARAAVPVSEAGADAVPVNKLAKMIGLRTYAGDPSQGVPHYGANVELLKKLAPKGARPEYLFQGPNSKASGIAKYLENMGLAVPASAASAIRSIKQPWRAPHEVAGDLKTWDSITNAYKSMLYPLWPAAHALNAASAFIRASVTGTAPRDYKNQMRLMRGAANIPVNQNILRSQYAEGQLYRGASPLLEILGPAATKKAAGKSIVEPIPGIAKPGPTGSTIGDVAYLWGKEGVADTMKGIGQWLMQGPRKILSGDGHNPFEMQNVRSAIAAGPVGQKDFPLLHAGRTTSAATENFFRGAQFNSLVRRGYSPREAGRIVAEHQFDYSNLTDFEKNVMRRLVPFYTFSRFNLPFEARMMLTKPAATKAQAAVTMQDRHRDDKYIPAYMNSGLAVRVGENKKAGTTQFVSSFGLPMEEAFGRFKFTDNRLDPLRTAQAFGGSLHPLIKLAIEGVSGQQLHSGRNLKDLRPPASASALGKLVGDDSGTATSQILLNSPLSRFITMSERLMDDRKTPLQKIANTLTGLHISDVDTAKLQSIDARELANRAAAASPRISQYTRHYVRPEDQPNMTQHDMRVLLVIEELRRQAEMRRRMSPGR